MDSIFEESAKSPKRVTARRHPLGPLLRREPVVDLGWFRVKAGAVALAALAILSLAVWLKPDARGFGTHEQLGLAPCSMVALVGLPCPTCGMTTAFSHTVRGQLWAAFLAQPFGLLLALAVVGVLILSLHSLVSGKRWTVNWYRISPGWSLTLAICLFGLAWLFKIIRTL